MQPQGHSQLGNDQQLCLSVHLMQRLMIVFDPKWDVRWLRANEIKDSPNSQAVPKILVLKIWHCLVPHWLRLLLFLQYSSAWLVSPVGIIKCFEIPKNSGPRKIKDSLTLQAVLNNLMHWYCCDSDLYICLLSFSRGRGVGLFEKAAFITDGFPAQKCSLNWNISI